MDKRQRVANYHGETVKAFRELLAATGLHAPSEIHRAHLNRNESQTLIHRYDESYPYIPKGSLLQPPYPDGWTKLMQEATATTFTLQSARP
jgi:hypothetical protein